MLIKKRQVLTETLMFALCAALTVNLYFTKPTENSDEPVSKVGEEVTGNLGDSMFVAGTTAQEGDTTEEDGDDNTESELVNNEVKTEETTADAEEYFSAAKLKRSNSFDEVIENIEKIL